MADRFVRGLNTKNVPPVIYHYTDDIGLRGILETGKLWMTDIFDLNDPSELEYGLSYAFNSLYEGVKQNVPGVSIFAERFQNFCADGEIRKIADFFVCSFSACGNELGQWRAYADNGCGYVLGFDANALNARCAQ